MPSWLDSALVAASLAAAAGYVWRRHRTPQGCGACPVASATNDTPRSP